MLPTVILPGYLEGAVAYRLEQSLQQMGFPAVTVPLRRGIGYPLWGRPVTPILQQLDRTVKQVLQQYNTSVNLIGHSAGAGSLNLPGRKALLRSWCGSTLVRGRLIPMLLPW